MKFQPEQKTWQKGRWCGWCFRDLANSSWARVASKSHYFRYGFTRHPQVMNLHPTKFTFWIPKIPQLRKGKSSIQLTSIRWGDETIHPSTLKHSSVVGVWWISGGWPSCIDFKIPSRWIADSPFVKNPLQGEVPVDAWQHSVWATSVSAIFLVVVEGGRSRRWAMKNRHRVFCKGILREMK